MAAIQVADIVGYSQLAGADEDARCGGFKDCAAMESIMASTRTSGGHSAMCLPEPIGKRDVSGRTI